MERTRIMAVASTILGQDEMDERLCAMKETKMRDTQECLNQIPRRDYPNQSMNRVRDFFYFLFLFLNSTIYSAVHLKQSTGSIYLLAINTMPT